MTRKGKMLEEKINSVYLNEVMILKLYLPEGYTPFLKYNLCIMQDGDDYYQIGKIATLSDEFHASNEISNVIFVGIHYIDKLDRRKKYHPDGEQQKAYRSFLAHEVVPYLDDTFSTFNTSHSRTLLGDSLAGSLALMTALSFPNIFGKVIMQSPLVNDTILKQVKQTSDLSLIDIYHIIGTEEKEVRTTTGDVIDFIKPNNDLFHQLKGRKTNYNYREIPNGKHTWKYWQKDLPTILRKAF